ncbi:hypothetical protein BGW38_008939, partial [Lunasporangiospora selenospora]
SPPTRSHRPVSIATVSTASTGMASLAPTMSTMGMSATSSAYSRPSIGSMASGRGNQHMVKGGQENVWQCAKKGNVALVKYHLEKDPGLINTPWKFDGRSILSSACASSQPHELVEYLIQRGAMVNTADSFHKRTALHTLCGEGGLPQDDWHLVFSQADQDANEQDVLAAMRFLLDHGAQVDAKNHWKETPLMKLLAARDCPLMVQELYSRGADSRLKSSKDVYPHGTALCYAAFSGRIKSLKWMVENDLLLNDEAGIKEAIRWAKLSKGGESSLPGASQFTSTQKAHMLKRREERKKEIIQLLEGWLGDGGRTRRVVLAKEVHAEDMDKAGSSSAPAEETLAASSSLPSEGSLKMPSEMIPLWREVQTLSGSLSSRSEQSSSSSSRMKWIPFR